jgi:4-hydroxybenzoate polyprenyltransferase
MTTFISPLLTRFPRLPDFIKLARYNRPIGIWLVMWPTLWAVYIGGDGHPSLRFIIIFTLGVALMRGAACAINDWADRDFDAQVWRTHERPLATGLVKPKEALVLFVILVAAAAALLPFLNLATFYLSLGALGLAVIYPFMKRYTYLPQVVLGIIHAWGALMAFVAQDKPLGPESWLIFIATICWVVVFDSYYALLDREDDLKIGVKSSAILFGDMDLWIIGGLQVLTLVTLWLAGHRLELAWPYTASLLIAAALFIWECRQASWRTPQKYQEAFLNNYWVGAVIFIGIFTGYVFRIPVTG